MYMATTGQGVRQVLSEASKAIVNCEVERVPSFHHSHVLVVDDDSGVRETLMLLLTAAGYQTSAARNGFEALQQLKRQTPAVLLCDLEMPRMSGMELLSIVRRRFPEIAVIAMSGSYRANVMPEGVMADAFYSKGQQKPPELFRIVAEVLRTSASQTRSRENRPAPIWGRWIGTDMCGISYVLVNCADCLRSFPVAMDGSEVRAVHTASCVFCGSEIQYIAEQTAAADQNFPKTILSILTQSQSVCDSGALPQK